MFIFLLYLNNISPPMSAAMVFMGAAFTHYLFCCGHAFFDWIILQMSLNRVKCQFPWPLFSGTETQSPPWLTKGRLDEE